ncbi:unnamed protein product [Brassica napus]|uniref:(rape) hypothetical protein n=1 Tax=Brassica napus TaxID=3708 RepID=A0A816ZQP4_BRANA|nr:unnamed protein product [Brassica napus]
MNSGIFMNSLGAAEDISDVFDSICTEVIFGRKFYFQSLSENLQSYCNTPWTISTILGQLLLFWLLCFFSFSLSYRLYALSWLCELLPQVLASSKTSFSSRNSIKPNILLRM